MSNPTTLVNFWQSCLAFAWMLAQEKAAVRELLWLWLLLLAAVCLVAIILSAARAIYLRSQQRKEAERELLAEFQEAVERGEMSPEEFARVRRLLIGRLTGELLPDKQLSSPQADIPPEQLPILESETYTESVASENAGQPQEKEQKTDSDSAPPQSSAST